MAGMKTSLPVPTEPWEAAKKRFLDDLTSGDVERFEKATLENLFYDASAAQKKHSQGSKSWIMQKRLASLVDGIQEYAGALDVYSNSYSLILCPIWGSIRVILHMLNEAGKFQEKVIDMLAQIGDVLPRFRIYQALFANHERLLLALTDAYLDVLLFCVRTKDFFVRAKKSLIPLTIILKGAWKPFRQDFENDIVNFRRHQKLVEREAKLAHMIEASKTRELERTRQALQTQNLRLKRRHRILSTLPTVDYRAKHTRLSALRHPGTNLWLQRDPRFVAWLSSQESDCLPCYGIPGSGKSVLAASVTDILLESHDGAETMVCYYYCDYAEVASLDLEYLIASLVKQILVRLPLERFDETFICPYGPESPLPRVVESLRFLSQLLAGFKTAFLIVDGVNELAQEGQRTILDLVESLLLISATSTKIFVTSRIEEPLIKRALRSHNGILVSTDNVQEDIALYVEAVVKSSLVEQNPLLKDEKLQREVIDALVTGAQGMFLWVRFQLFDIGEATSRTAIRFTIQNLPRSLAETYSRILEKVYYHGGMQRIALIKKIFLWITCARRPLRIEELEEAVGVEKDDTYLHAERTANGAGERLISACGKLVSYDAGNQAVTFAHHTVQQFLTSRPESTSDAPIGLIHIDLADADQEVGEICMAYLSFSDFETQLVKAEEPTTFDKKELEHLIWSEVPLGSHIRGLVSWSLSKSLSRSAPAREETRNRVGLHTPILMKPSDTLTERYALLDYITAFWPFHVAGFSRSTTKWSTLEHIVLHHQLIFEFRPWKEEQHMAKVTAVLESLQRHRAFRFRLWSSQSSSLQENDQEALYIYVWAMGHSVRALLSLSSDLGLVEYIREAYPDLNRALSLEQSYISSLTTEREPQLRNIYSGKFILRFLRQYQVVRGDKFNVLDKALLDMLVAEFQAWAGPDCPLMHHLFVEAMIHALDVGDEAMFNSLVNWHIRDGEQLCNTMITIVKAGHGRRTPLQRLICHQVQGSCTKETVFELAFAMQDCLPILIDIVQEYRKILSSLQPSLQIDIMWLLVILMLLSPKHAKLAGELIPLDDSFIHRKTLKLPDYDWTYAALGTESTFQKLAAIDGMDIVAIAFAEASKYPWTNLVLRNHDYPPILSKLVMGRQRNLDPELYEPHGIKCLNWAAECGAYDTLFYLSAGYVDFVKNPRNAMLSRSILAYGISRGGRHMDYILKLSWPPGISRAALDHPNYPALGLEYNEGTGMFDYSQGSPPIRP